MRFRTIASHLLTFAFFVLIACLAHWKLVFQGLILVDYDAFVYFYANREYTAARLLDGQLPLWNPYLFAGAPHLANPQSAVFYPGTWIFLLLPTPYAYTAGLVIHTAIAGFAMYALARDLLAASRIGALVAGTCYMLSGAITAQGGHLNQLSAAALLPFILMGAHRAVERISVRWSLVTALLLALQLLAGHPQVTYMTLVLVGFMLVWEIAATEPRRWFAQIAIVILAAVLAGGLSAVQLLPTLEATRLGIRSAGLSIGEASAGSLPPELLPLALLPGYVENPASTEFLGFIGVAGLTLAVLGATAAISGRQGWLLVAAVLSLLVALGGYAQVYESLFGIIPGLADFRVPARWLLPWTVCVSLLAGAAIGRTPPIGWPRRAAALAMAALPVGLALWASQWSGVISNYVVPSAALNAWPVILGLTLVLWLSRIGRLRVVVASLALVLVIGELLVARSELPFSHAVPPLAWRFESSTVQALREVHPAFRVLSIAGDGYQPDRTAALRQQYPGLVDYAFDLFITATKWSEVQAPNLPSVYRFQSVDGYDGGVFPLKHYVLAAALFHPLGDIRPDGVLISSLDSVPRRSSLDLFGVSTVVGSVEKDVEVNGVGFDRAVVAHIHPGQSLDMNPLPDWPITRLALLIGADGTPPGPGEPLLEIRARDLNGRQSLIPLTSGVDLPRVEDVQAGRAPGTIVPPWRASSGLPTTAFVDIRLELGPLMQLEIENVSSDSRIVLNGASVQGRDAGQQRSLSLDPELNVRSVGDIRVYTRSNPLPRAYITHRVAAMTDDDASVALFEPDWDPAVLTILEPEAAPRVDAPAGPEQANLVRSMPEEVVIDVQASSAGLLVLSDPWYPGWGAEIDGRRAPILRANLYFRAVEVPSGHHEVRFVYDPATLKMGAAVSAVTIGLLVVLAVFGQRLARVLW